MKLNKKMIKKNKKNKRKQKKVVKENIETVSEKISACLDQADARLIKNITTILGPKLALKLCNQLSDVEETGGINDPQRPSQRLSKLESFLYLIENDASISENKKSSISDQKESATSDSLAPITPRIEKRKAKKIKHKVKGIQSELNKLCLNQIKNEAKNPKSSNYFAIRNISKLSDSKSSTCSFIKPSRFNISVDNGVPSLTPNYSNALITRPRLDLKPHHLKQISSEPNGSTGAQNANSGALQSNTPFGDAPAFGSPFKIIAPSDTANNGGYQAPNSQGPFFANSSGPSMSHCSGGVTINLSVTPVLVRTVTPVIQNTTNHYTNVTNHYTNNYGPFNPQGQTEHGQQSQSQPSQLQLPSLTSDSTAPSSSSNSNNVASLFAFGSNQ